MQKLKKPVSILLVFMMIVSLFAAVPMTVNAAPPSGGGGGGTGTGTGTEIGPVHVSAGFATQPYAIEGLVANGSEQALISAGTTADGATAYYYMTTEDITGDQANSLFNNPSKPGSFSTEIPKGRDAGTYYIWYAIDGGSNYEDLLPYMEINNTHITNKLTVTIAAPEYYIVGIGGDWNTLKDEYKLTKNPNNDAEYMFEGLTVGANTELKVKGTNTYYYPDGTGNNFTLVDAGTYDIYFRPDGQGGEGWWYGDIYATPSAPAPVTYTVTWKNWDGSVLKTDENVAAGSTPTYDGTTPYKADGANCIYTFSGWTPEVSAVTGDATYTAQFTESEKPETIKDCNNKYGIFRLYSNVPIVSFSNVNDLLTGAIIPITYGDSNTMIPVQDAKGYSYKFYDQTGTEIPAQIANSSSAPGSNYELSDDVTVYTNVINFTRPAGCTAIYIVATAPAPAPEGINYGGDNYIDPKGTQEVSSSDEGKTKFGLDLDNYLNMQMLGIQLKNSIATEGGDDGVRFVTAVNSNLLKGDNIEDYGYIVAKIDSNIESLYNNMNKFTAEKFIAQGAADTNIFTCKGSSNSISGEFGKYSSNTDYKYVTLSVTGTSGKSGNLIARFYVKTKDGQYHYADYINGSNQTYSGMTFDLSAVSANLG